MGTTSDKLTYLSTTKTKIKDAINLANTSITNETFRLYEEKIKQAIINTMLDKWKVWDNFDKVTGSGTDLTLNNTHKAPLKLDLNENTYQYSTTGKNLLPNNVTSQTINGVTYTKNSDGTIIANNQATSQSNLYLIGGASEYVDMGLSVGTYTLSGCPSGGSSTSYRFYAVIQHSDSTTDVYTDNGSGISFELQTGDKFRIFVRVSNGYTANNVVFKPMLESGSSATSYEPYTNGASPNPSYPQEIHNVSGDNYLTICGKNLFDKSKATANYRIGPDGEPLSAGGYSLSSFIKVLPNTTYVRNLEITTNNAVALYDSNKTFISRLTSGNTFTTTNETYYVRTSIMTTSLDNLQLEVGNQSSIYEAYQENKYPLYLGVKNLFDKNNATIEIGTINATGGFDYSTSRLRVYYIEVKENTKYTLSTSSSDLQFVPYYYNSSKTFISYDSGWKNLPYTFTTPTNTKYIALLFKNSTETPSVNMIGNLQLEKGSKVNSYSEYGKEPIEYCGIGDNKNKFIRTSGKNLFDKDNASILAAYIDTNIIDTSAKAKTTYISCKPNTTYTISKTNKGNNNRFTIATTSSTPALNVSVSQYNNNNSASTMTITTNSTANYLCLTFYHTDETSLTMQQVLDSIQIEKNNEATSYEPFGINEWWYKEAVYKRILDGTENWIISTQLQVEGYKRFYISDSDVMVSHNEVLIKSYYFRGITRATRNTDYKNTIYLDDSFISINVDSSICGETANDFKSWLSANNTITYYVLKTPTYTKITDYTLLSQLEAIYNAISMQGATNILQENNDLPFNIDATALEVI